MHAGSLIQGNYYILIFINFSEFDHTIYTQRGHGRELRSRGTKLTEKDKENGAQRVTNSFMARNRTFAKKNFGGNSDNATGIANIPGGILDVSRDGEAGLTLNMTATPEQRENFINE